MSISSFISCRHHQTTRYIPLYNIVHVLSLCSQVWLLSLRGIWCKTPFIVFIEQFIRLKKTVFLKEPNPQMSCVQYTSAFFMKVSCVVCTRTLLRENASILTHLPTYPPTCLPINLLTHQPTYPPTCMPINPPTHLPAYLPACLLTYVPAHPPTFLPTYLPSDLPTYLPTYLFIYLPANI